jgi:hypothetical protein
MFQLPGKTVSKAQVVHITRFGSLFRNGGLRNAISCSGEFQELHSLIGMASTVCDAAASLCRGRTSAAVMNFTLSSVMGRWKGR